MLSCTRTLYFRVGVTLLVKFNQKHKKATLIKNSQKKGTIHINVQSVHICHNKNASHMYTKVKQSSKYKKKVNLAPSKKNPPAPRSGHCSTHPYKSISRVVWEDA